MKALAWHGKHDIRCETVPDPTIEHPRDAIIKVRACAICGSDLHIFDGVDRQNKLQSAIATVMPSGMVAEQHPKMAAHGTAEK